MQKKSIFLFRKTVYDYYEKEGRHDLPWRITQSPYTAFISEMMLQQTQVDRVIPKFTLFIQQLPDFVALASASQNTVLSLWQGLGYNRRALFLHRSAQKIVADFNAKLPDNSADLMTLPGIGPATAGALTVYAYGKTTPYIETNIRAVFIHHFFPNETDVSDQRLIPFVEECLDTEDPYRWYSALMDYGTFLKREEKNPARRSKHHVKQSSFEGSPRQVRGAAIKHLLSHGSLSLHKLKEMIDDPQNRVDAIVVQLEKEGFIQIQENGISII